MRTFTAATVIAICLLAVSAAAQQRPSQFTPLTVEEPRAFPGAGAARQLDPDGLQPIHRGQPPLNVQLVSAQELVTSAGSKSPLRLAPRSEVDRLRSSGTSKASAASPSQALGTVAGSLGLVLALFIVVVWFSRRFAPAGTSVLPKEAVELLGRSSLAARQQLQLVRIGNKLLLVALSPVGVETLTEITEPTEVEHLVALCRRGQTGSSSAAFRQALAQLGSEPAQRGFVGASRPGSRGGR